MTQEGRHSDAEKNGDPFEDRRFDRLGRSPLLLADDEDAAGSIAAADVQHRKLLCVLDQVVARAMRYLPMAIEHLAHEMANLLLAAAVARRERRVYHPRPVRSRNGD
jgi:hypothetical protein